jgi:hypothetical protein
MEWDVKKTDKIEYFDPTLSYELTGYRPINDTQGLDFDPKWFQEDAINKVSTGNYSQMPKTAWGTKRHLEFWRERFNRCENGYECNGYRVTGDNYFYLNFYHMKNGENSEKTGSGRQISFPEFLVFQYMFFHYVEMCEMLHKDIGLLKARSLGFSEMAASLAVRPFITTKNYRTVVTAFSDGYLRPLLNKIWLQLDWLNSETEGAFKRVRMVKNTDMYKRASKKLKDGTESGRMSEIEAIVADSPEKVRGDRVDRLFFEEFGSNKVAEKSYIQGQALVTVMGKKIGTRIAWGTGGDSRNIDGIRKMSTNPLMFNLLPVKHNYTDTREYLIGTLFFPAYIMAFELKDERGWCPEEKAIEHFLKERNAITDPMSLITHKAEYCFTIEDALLQEGDNLFPKEELTEQYAAISLHKTVKPPISGFLTWKKDTNGDDTKMVEWTPSPEGKILILEPPLKGEDGSSFVNLYVGGIDSIDIGSQDGATDSNVSDFCIVIKKRVFGLNEPKYVAIYKDRPKDPREAYQIAAKLLCWYNCKAVLENTRTAIITYFREKKLIDLLMKRPRSTLADVTKTNSNMIGAPATLKVIAHYRELIYDFVLDYWFTIGFLEMIQQLLRYTDANKKKFDIVAAMGQAELGDEEMSMKKPREEKEDSGFRDFGYFTDSSGRKHFGMIPRKDENYEYRPTERKSTWDDKGFI